MKKYLVFCYLIFASLLLIACSQPKPKPTKPDIETPQEEVDSNANPNSSIVTNIHYVFGTVKNGTIDTITVETENQNLLTFDLLNINSTNIDNFKLNDIVKVYYRDHLEENGSHTVKLIRLEVITAAPSEQSQSIIGIVLQNTGDTILLEVAKDQVITVTINPINIQNMPQIFSGDIIKVYYPGSIDLSTPTNINATKIEMIKSSITQI